MTALRRSRSATRCLSCLDDPSPAGVVTGRKRGRLTFFIFRFCSTWVSGRRAHTRSAGYASRSWLIPLALRGHLQPPRSSFFTREAANYQQRVRRLAFYERNGFAVTNGDHARGRPDLPGPAGGCDAGAPGGSQPDRRSWPTRA